MKQNIFTEIVNIEDTKDLGLNLAVGPANKEITLFEKDRALFCLEPKQAKILGEYLLHFGNNAKIEAEMIELDVLVE